jgi:LAGLIDADG endonuclease
LLGIQHSLGGIGTVSSNQSICVFRVRKFQQILELVKFFDKYPLISRKRVDYLLFKQIVSIMELKEHLTLEGLQKIINIKATLNFGLSKELQLMFPETIPVPRLLIETCKIPHPQ